VFYVYQHRRNDTDEVFYVGKGSGKRINCGKKGGTKSRSQFWQNVVKKAGGFKAEKIIVHGHTPEKDVVNFPYRINIDTGCYFSGKLSCICLNDLNEERHFINT